MARVLFFVLDGAAYGHPGQVNFSLLNAANFVVSEIAEAHHGDVRIISNETEILSNVLSYQATHVVLEGIWVEPTFISALKAAHPTINWAVRIHSELPFLAVEDSAVKHITDYLSNGIEIICNSPRAHEQIDLIAFNVNGKCTYLPNCYTINYSANPIVGLDTSAKNTLDIGCFGATRVLKNTLQQFFIAFRYAVSVNKGLRFHVNAGVTPEDDVILQNVRDAAAAVGADVIVHAWEDRATFLATVRGMDLILQLSLSETFNNVSADAILVGRPLLTSKEITFTNIHGDPSSVDDCLQKLPHIMGNKRFFINANRVSLKSQAGLGKTYWIRYLN